MAVFRKEKEDFNESELRKHKAKYEVTRDYLVFYPSPHLKQEDYATKKLPNTTVTEILSEKKIEGIFENKNLVDIPYGHVTHGFLIAAATSWSEHYPFAIKPIDIWLLILQAVAIHVDKHSEEVRSKWVKHEGKKPLIVVNNTFILHNPDNDWASVIDEFNKQIDENTVQDTVELLTPNFNHVNNHELISAKVTIMDICQNYFEYLFYTLCGFPKIYLYGNQEDWTKLKEKTELLLSTKCEQKFAKTWANQLYPILDEFIKAYDGKIDCSFWNRMIKKDATRGSGARSWFNGWINVFFPYIGKNLGLNAFCFNYDIKDKDGPDINYFPTGLSKAPVTWFYYNQKIPLEFKAGFLGVEQDENDLTLRSVIGWYIEDVQNADKNNSKDDNKDDNDNDNNNNTNNSDSNNDNNNNNNNNDNNVLQ